MKNARVVQPHPSHLAKWLSVSSFVSHFTHDDKEDKKPDQLEWLSLSPGEQQHQLTATSRNCHQAWLTSRKGFLLALSSRHCSRTENLFCNFKARTTQFFPFDRLLRSDALHLIHNWMISVCELLFDSYFTLRLRSNAINQDKLARVSMAGRKGPKWLFPLLLPIPRKDNLKFFISESPNQLSVHCDISVIYHDSARRANLGFQFHTFRAADWEFREAAAAWKRRLIRR